MKVAAKLVSVVVLVVASLLLIDAYLLVKRERTLLENEMQSEALLFGNVLKSILTDTEYLRDPEEALSLLRDAGHDDSLNVNWVWLDRLSEGVAESSLGNSELTELRKGEPIFVKDEDGKRFFAYIPVLIRNQKGALEISESLGRVDQAERVGSLRILILAGLIVVASGLAISFLGASMIGRPLQQLSEQARSIGRGNWEKRVALERNDELGELSSTMDQMCDQLIHARDRIRAETEERIAALERLRHKDRLRTVGRLASGVAHELGSPLNVISGRAGMIMSGSLSLEECRENARIVRSQSKRMAQIIQQLLDFARRHPLRKTDSDLNALVRKSVNLLEPLAGKKNVTIRITSSSNSAVANLDAAQIQQVFTNLLVNGIQSMPGGGVISIEVEHKKSSSPGSSDMKSYIAVSVEDQGQGIPEETLPQLFEPFFTTKKVGEGSGLGLSIAYGLVQDHGGWIEVQSKVGKGSVFTVYLPEVAS
jgi:signal transduction histidine kinase